ncbi:hypothetical protein [Ruegeria lacuscaerulensis]|uniref:hypothetical protein n=1 Tax=Ruegeria lacuscaerulensis TaxID=55218 RepID=UPI00147B9E93|nr:hypothetical protein [Ruegeria lacuscaerulensis]
MSKITVEIQSRKAPIRRWWQKRRRADIPTAPSNGTWRAVARAAWWIAKPRRITWAPAAVAALVLSFGTPHLLVYYRCGGVGTPGQRCYECNYYGVQGLRGQLGERWNCPVITMIPVNWNVLRRQLGLNR